MATYSANGARLIAGDHVRLFAAVVLTVYAAVVAVALLFWTTPSTPDLLAESALLGASSLAAAICLLSAKAPPRPLNLPWLLFGLSAAFSTLGHVGELLNDVAVRTAAIQGLFIAGHAFFVAALVVIIQQTEEGRWSELAIDVALLVTAAVTLVLHWAPDLIEPAVGNSPVFSAVIAPAASLCAGLLMIAILATPSAAFPRSVSYAVAAATFALALSTLTRGTTATLGGIGVWVFVAFAATSAMRLGHRGLLPPQRERLRQFVAPSAAVVLAAIALDAAVNSTLDRPTSFALAALGLLAAFRLAQLLRATATQVDERRELAQTRALIEVSRALAGATDVDTTLRSVTEWARRVLNAKAASIELLSNDGSTLELRAASGMSNDVVGMTFSVDSSFTGWVIRSGESRVATQADHDALIGKESAVYLGNAPVAAVPLRYRERIFGVITCVGTDQFTAADLELLNAFANQAAIALEDARLFEQVRALTLTDPLTGLANRRRLDRELQREFAAAKRGRQLVAVMFDFDDFKLHNDRYGHLAGDRALRHFAQALEACTRAMNLAARFGGDEFFALLADSDRAGALVFVQRVIERFEGIMRDARNPVLKVSAGVAEYKADMSNPLELIEAADRALYISKSEGNPSR